MKSERPDSLNVEVREKGGVTSKSVWGTWAALGDRAPLGGEEMGSWLLDILSEWSMTISLTVSITALTTAFYKNLLKCPCVHSTSLPLMSYKLLELRGLFLTHLCGARTWFNDCCPRVGAPLNGRVGANMEE